MRGWAKIIRERRGTVFYIPAATHKKKDIKDDTNKAATIKLQDD